jgi:alpha-beta hydrolase superfamily lysophospholipase
MDHCSNFLVNLGKLCPNIGSVVTEDGYLENKALWREGNGPFALINEPGDPCVVLIHGLSDSPYSVRDLSIALHVAGYNVVAPLLPGHGLLDPDKEFEDDSLYKRWRRHTTEVVSLVHTQLQPSKLFIGGYSTGGSLALNAVLSMGQETFAGLLMFAPAFDLYSKDDVARIPGAQRFAVYYDGKYTSGTTDPYRYDNAPMAGVVQLTCIIDDNIKRMENITMPVLVVTSLDDAIVDPKATMDWMCTHCTQGRFVAIHSPGLAHGNLTVKVRGSYENRSYYELQEEVIRFLSRIHTETTVTYPLSTEST